MLYRCPKCEHWWAVLWGTNKACPKCGTKGEVQVKDYR